jgi:two-component system response regulator NreC
MKSNEPIRVLIVDDHAVLRAGLRLLLDSQPDLTVVGEADSAEQALALDGQLQPDVVLMDLTLPARRATGPLCQAKQAETGLAGLEAVRCIKANRPEARVLVLTMHDDEQYLRAVLEAGGNGYVLKHAADTELLSAIRAVHQGGTYLHPAHTKVLLEGVLERGRQTAQPAGTQPLSAREEEVLRLIALGYTNAQVAQQLFLSVKTVETYRARGMVKLGLTSRAALVRYAQEQGWLS